MIVRRNPSDGKAPSFADRWSSLLFSWSFLFSISNPSRTDLVIACVHRFATCSCDQYDGEFLQSSSSSIFALTRGEDTHFTWYAKRSDMHIVSINLLIEKSKIHFLLFPRRRWKERRNRGMNENVWKIPTPSLCCGGVNKPNLDPWNIRVRVLFKQVSGNWGSTPSSMEISLW